jgi:hypothetical protein
MHESEMWVPSQQLKICAGFSLHAFDHTPIYSEPMDNCLLKPFFNVFVIFCCELQHFVVRTFWRKTRLLRTEPRLVIHTGNPLWFNSCSPVRTTVDHYTGHDTCLEFFTICTYLSFHTIPQLAEHNPAGIMLSVRNILVSSPSVTINIASEINKIHTGSSVGIAGQPMFDSR